ncbi:MAG TPA: histidine kinase dimerization/phospho-acceptor domain-containing protein, partial [Burkholderiales bacterium]|nr:histidine kinase dimerization/phospho-acceptor domain-containing protein [Burkholderiales bacterium]
MLQRVVPTLTLAVGILSALIAVGLPAGYFYLSYRTNSATAQAEAMELAAALGPIVRLSPGLWEFQQDRLDAVIQENHSWSDLPEQRAVLDRRGEPITALGDPLEPPLMQREAPLMDMGERVGKVRVSRSLGPLVLETALVGALALALGSGVFAIAWLYPLRALNRLLRRIEELNESLAKRVLERTAELDDSNRAMESFTYSVAQNLRAPLRSIDGYCDALLKDAGTRLDPDQRGLLEQSRVSAQHMAGMIDAVVQLSRVARAPVLRGALDLSAMAREVAEVLQSAHPGRTVQWVIAPGLTAEADPALARNILHDLFNNAWNFTRLRDDPRIEFGALPGQSPTVYFVRDNGAGFDPWFADRLFQPFEKLPGAGELKGDGIGLVTAQRAVH